MHDSVARFLSGRSAHSLAARGLSARRGKMPLASAQGQAAGTAQPCPGPSPPAAMGVNFQEPPEDERVSVWQIEAQITTTISLR